jgi:lipopolysaccharide biosynthesis glycosyltransferase
MSLYKYVCYMSNDRDFRGVLLLNYNLKKVNSKYSLICIVLEKVSQNIIATLEKHGINTHRFNLTEILTKFGMALLDAKYISDQNYYGKFLIFTLMQYQKLIYLDADMLILKNIDHLFDQIDTGRFRNATGESATDGAAILAEKLLPESMELPDSFRNRPTPYNLLDPVYLNRVSMVYDMSMTSDRKKLIFIENAYNSGIILTRPDMNYYKLCYQYVAENTISDIRNSLLTDQQVLNTLIRNNQMSYKMLQLRYNMLPAMIDFSLQSGALKNETDIHVIHYILKPKPWEFYDVLMDNNVKHGSSPRDIHVYRLWVNLYKEFIDDYYFNMQNSNIGYTQTFEAFYMGKSIADVQNKNHTTYKHVGLTNDELGHII